MSFYYNDSRRWSYNGSIDSQRKSIYSSYGSLTNNDSSMVMNRCLTNFFLDKATRLYLALAFSFHSSSLTWNPWKLYASTCYQFFSLSLSMNDIINKSLIEHKSRLRRVCVCVWIYVSTYLSFKCEWKKSRVVFFVLSHFVKSESMLLTNIHSFSRFSFFLIVLTCAIAMSKNSFRPLPAVTSIATLKFSFLFLLLVF